MTLHPNTLGVDIAKAHLDLFDRASARHRRISNTHDAIAALIAETAPDTLIVFEATSACDTALRLLMTEAKRPFARVNPRHAREFARCTGVASKTDKVDARVLARMGHQLQLTPTVEPSPERRELSELMARRSQLVSERKREKTRLKQAHNPVVIESIETQIAHLGRCITELEARIARLVETSPELTEASTRLQSAPGVGPVIATALLANLPELGHRDRRAIASLVGVAPLANDSGRKKGRRRIWGGRRELRNLLYMAAATAWKKCDHLASVRERMLAAGKAPKTIRIAIARKLLVALNAMLANGTDYQSPRPE